MILMRFLVVLEWFLQRFCFAFCILDFFAAFCGGIVALVVFSEFVFCFFLVSCWWLYRLLLFLCLFSEFFMVCVMVLMVFVFTEFYGFCLCFCWIYGLNLAAFVYGLRCFSSKSF